MRDHRNLEAWRSARQVTLAVLRISDSHWKPSARAIFAQLQRASLSVQLNIAEGYTFGESPTFTRHLGISYGSAIETGELLDLICDAGIAPRGVVLPIHEANARSQRLLVGLLKRRRPLKHA